MKLICQKSQEVNQHYPRSCRAISLRHCERSVAISGIASGLTPLAMTNKHSHCPEVVILGVGNLLLKDEGIGIHAIHSLMEQNLDYVNLTLIDGGTSSDIPLLADGIDKLIVIDAVKGGGEPGTIYRFGIDDISVDSINMLSLHQTSILDSLKMLTLLGKQPKSIVIIGIEPEEIAWGLEPSPQLQSKMPEIMKLVIKELRETDKLKEEEVNDSL